MPLPARAALVGGIDTLVYTMAADQTINIRWCNRNAAIAKIRLAITSGGAPAAGDYMDYDLTMQANGIVEDFGIRAYNGEKIYCRSDLSNVDVRVHGI